MRDKWSTVPRYPTRNREARYGLLQHWVPVRRRTFPKFWPAMSGDSGTEGMAPDLFVQLADHSSDAVLVADIGRPSQAIVYANAAFERLTGYRRDEVLGKNCRYLQGADRLQPEIDEIRQAIAARAGCEVRLRNYRKDGGLFWNSLRLAPLGPSGAPTHYAGFLRDVTGLVDAEARIEAATYRDALTGCLNRDGLLQSLGPLCAAHRLLLAKIDIAHFHDINSGYGYELGDAMLRETARRLSALEGEVVARVGSDQFAVAITFADDVQIPDILARVALSLGRRFDLPGAALTVRFATGYTIGSPGDDPLMLVRQAGAALAQSNASPLREPCAFAREAERQAFNRIRLTSELQQGILADEFLYHYQPKIDLQTGEFVGAEALLRWQHGVFGLQSPDSFVQLAEDTGLILDIGARGFREVADFAVRINRWRRRPLRVAINVSAIEFTHRDMVSFLTDILKQTGIDPSWLIAKTPSTRAYAAKIITRATSVAAGAKIAMDPIRIAQTPRSAAAHQFLARSACLAREWMPSRPNSVAILRLRVSWSASHVPGRVSLMTVNFQRTGAEIARVPGEDRAALSLRPCRLLSV